ncbi:T9SS type A sorting domain-containing protein [Flavobacterium sp. F372]|uniref:T9SS type A sorting domain-containing protein n=1 Tax=Flavobacterium bernardetii TaxID=2813823 RepID=A0ABR7J0Q0_9FLAO|nr:T9SS type A sorting domain-containing protein [Flavobacterium bernardetii]MBC5835482.1 T9SS type A sorting domain-containing protein [Flavobacterium bernardetii]NHF69825.1 T9SS type A sorting domain-containing protein [Flavobacterium bernardetii]
MKKLIILFLLIFTQISFAQTEWFAAPAPTGSSSGNGTISNPWDLQTALNNFSNSIQPGDILWLRGGVYRGQFDSFLQGTVLNPITVQSYTGEKAILNGNTIFPTPMPNPNPPLVNPNKGIQNKLKINYWGIDPEQKAEFYHRAKINPSLRQNGLFLINLPKIAVLNIYGGYVHFKNFEITCLGFFERDYTKPNFFLLDGIYNHEIQNNKCKFIELVIYNLPGTGVGEWKNANGTEYNSCIVYNNGFYTSTTLGGILNGRGHGPAFYIQNNNDSEKLFKNNIAFSNLGTGLEIWSASNTVGSVTDFVKNIKVQENTVFDHQKFYDNINFKPNVLMAACSFSARNIEVLENTLYHSMNFMAGDGNQGVAVSFGGACEGSVGTNHPPLKNIKVENNFMAGRNSTLRIFKTLATNTEPIIFRNNLVYGRVNELRSLSMIDNNLDHPNWISNFNSFYAINVNGDRIFNLTSGGQLNFSSWKLSPYFKDLNGVRTLIPSPSVSVPNPILPTVDYFKIRKFDYSNDKYFVTIVKNNIGTNNYTADISNSISNIPIGTPYRIIDVENYHAEKLLPFSNIYTGTAITFNMQSTAFEAPLNLPNTPFGANVNTNGLKTPNNFGCFIIEFDLCSIQSSPVIIGSTYACDDYNESTFNSTVLTSNQTAVWSVTGGNGTIVGSNNQDSVEVSWNSLPGEITLTITNEYGCSKSASQTIVEGCACDIMNANYFTADLNSNTVSNFQFFNSIANDFGTAISCDFGDGTSPTSNPVSHTYLVNGTYIIDMLFYGKQCSSHYYKTVVITSNAGKVSNGQNKIVKASVVENSFVVYPNPANTTITIKGDNIEKEEIEMYNMLGQKVLQRSLIANESVIDISGLTNGVYSLYFVKSKTSQKIIKQ